jgi:serine/threonine protein kinase
MHPPAAGVLAERFARERDVLAALNHPHIATLHDAGVAVDGQPYIVLEHVAGVPITDGARAQGLGQRERIGLIVQVLDALSHAHRHMVVHRDLKPANILVTAEGAVKLLDFGIAKLLEPSPGAAALTQDTATLMTPRYATPEQIDGRPISAATDVHGAGAVLYELLTGRPPYGAGTDSVPLTIHAVLNDALAPAGLGLDLDTVLAKARAKDPAARYASAEAFADDLRRWLAHQPIRARRVSA